MLDRLTYLVFLACQVLVRKATCLRSCALRRSLQAKGALIARDVFFGAGARVCLGRGARLSIGAGTFIDEGAELIIAAGAELTVGERSYIGKGAILSSTSTVTLGRDTMIAHRTTVIDSDHRHDDDGTPYNAQGGLSSPIVIGENSWLACQVTVLRGTELGPGSIVGANSVIKGNYPPGSRLGGVPATELRRKQVARRTKIEAAPRRQSRR